MGRRSQGQLHRRRPSGAADWGASKLDSQRGPRQPSVKVNRLWCSYVRWDYRLGACACTGVAPHVCSRVGPAGACTSDAWGAILRGRKQRRAGVLRVARRAPYPHSACASSPLSQCAASSCCQLEQRRLFTTSFLRVKSIRKRPFARVPNGPRPRTAPPDHSTHSARTGDVWTGGWLGSWRPGGAAALPPYSTFMIVGRERATTGDKCVKKEMKRLVRTA